ncbi:hypothetical protein LB467_10095 [Salegentibacter sp. JZCK2]|uniref:hypothetical protein n=1 Tax=Salegentibacter tibetensis TaxID=2873600 RepID=UPI001CCD472E|nr:hypothetical protein [Salegentibacter tibetensis]MBZ9730036.1 hypothetical protein [Salegentibacter tibetensis]
MKTQQSKFRIMIFLWIPLLLIGSLVSCKNGEKSDFSHQMDIEERVVVEHVTLPVFGNLVEVKTTGMNFILPDEIPSGWTTFRYSNESQLTHFMLIDKLPVYKGKQITYADFEKIPPVFIDAMDLINSGKSEEGFAEFDRLPVWTFDIIYSGGVGLVSPGETAQTTVYVEPGTYVIECYVKTGGKFHPMSKQLDVKKDSSYETPPVSTLNMAISREGGIEMHEAPKAGLHTIAVQFKDQEPHEHFLGHDVNLVKLEKDTDLNELASWMNWADPDGLNTPAPVKFLGGTQEMPEGNTAYITVNLKPGNYAWVAEVPNPRSKNMLKTFTVSQDENGRIGGGKD